MPWTTVTPMEEIIRFVSLAQHDLALLATLSHTADFSVGCYCEHEDRCHRSILKQLLIEHGALLA